MLSKYNYLEVGDDGTFLQNNGYTHQDANALIQAIRDTGAAKVAIYSHGGLVSREQGMKAAAAMSGPDGLTGTHVVSIVWKTGLVETLIDGLDDINGKWLFRRLVSWGKRLAKRRVMQELNTKGLVAPSPFFATAGAINSFDQQLSTDEWTVTFKQATPDIDAVEAEVFAEIQAEIQHSEEVAEEFKRMELELQVSSSDAGVGQNKAFSIGSISRAGWLVARVVGSVIRRFIDGTHHGIASTVIEEVLQALNGDDIGKWFWDKMKKAAADMFKSNQSRSGNSLHAGSYLIEELGKLQQETDIQIDLIGHSAGSILICEMFKAMRERDIDLKVKNVFFMAPAVRHDLFIEEMIDRTPYERFKMFTMTDHYEINDETVPLYPRSLLYLISGVLEGRDDVPLLGMERYLTGRSPYNTNSFKKVRGFLGQQDRLVLSNTDYTDPDAQFPNISRSVTHGDFDNDPGTLQSISVALST